MFVLLKDNWKIILKPVMNTISHALLCVQRFNDTYSFLGW